jgi:RNA polymerase sigma-70 factor, ECF subfamily
MTTDANSCHHFKKLVPTLEKEMEMIEPFAADEITQSAEGERVIALADFETLYELFQIPLTRYVFHLIHNKEGAQDLVQDVFMKVYQALLEGTTLPASKVKAWLYRIAYHAFIDMYRRERLMRLVPLAFFSGDEHHSEDIVHEGQNIVDALSAFASHFPGGSPSSSFEEQVADRESIDHLLQALPPSYAICVRFVVGGYSYAEISHRLGISVAAVKMRLLRARRQCKAIAKQS